MPAMSEEDTLLKVAFGCILLGFLLGIAMYPWIAPEPKVLLRPPFPHPSAAADAWRVGRGIRGYALSCPQEFNGDPCTLTYLDYRGAALSVELLCRKEGCIER